MAEFKAPAGPARPRGSKDGQYGLILPKKQDETVEEVEQPKPVEPAKPALPDAPQVERAFDPPFWCKPPPHKYVLEVIKSGVIDTAIDLFERNHWIIGRLPQPIVDISVDNPTVSRQHAVILFRDNGQAFVYDLGSVHGTFVNKKQINAKAYVELQSGDQLKFGQSSRFYVLSGGPPPKEQKAEPTPEQKRILEQKRQKALEIVRSKREKETVEEIRRAREMDENEDEDEIVRREYDAATEESDAALEAEAEKARQFYKAYYGDEEDDEADSFYDRTGDVERQKRQARQHQQAESFESLSAKIKILEKISDTITKEIDALSQKSTSSSPQAGPDNNDDDDLDSYMASLSNNFQEEKISKKKAVLKEIGQESERLKKLAAIVAPTEGTSSTKLNPQQLKLVKIFEREWWQRKLDTDGPDAKTIPVEMDYNEHAHEQPKQSTLPPKGVHEEPPAKRHKPDNHPSEPAPVSELRDFAAHHVDDGFTHGSVEPPKQEAKESLQNFAAPAPVNQKKRKRPTEQPKSELDSEDSSKYSDWVPPTEQAGDGRTDLNAKLGY